MSYCLQRLPGGVYKKFSGVVDVAEYMVSSTEVANLPDYADLRFSINDFSGIDGYKASHLEMTNVIAMDMGVRERNPDIQLAIIATDAKLLALIRKLYQSATGYRIDYFATLAEAQDGLSRKLGFPVVVG